MSRREELLDIMSTTPIIGLTAESSWSSARTADGLPVIPETFSVFWRYYALRVVQVASGSGPGVSSEPEDRAVSRTTADRGRGTVRGRPRVHANSCGGPGLGGGDRRVPGRAGVEVCV